MRGARPMEAWRMKVGQWRGKRFKTPKRISILLHEEPYRGGDQEGFAEKRHGVVKKEGRGDQVVCPPQRRGLLEASAGKRPGSSGVQSKRTPGGNERKRQSAKNGSPPATEKDIVPDEQRAIKEKIHAGARKLHQTRGTLTRKKGPLKRSAPRFRVCGCLPRKEREGWQRE